MLLKLENIGKRRGDGYELVIESFRMEAREHIAIVGPSGCGKSTTLDIIGMVLEPDVPGVFTFNPNGVELDIAAMWKAAETAEMTELRRRYLGYVLQTGEIFSFLNVKENIELTALAAGLAPGDASSRADELLERLELAHLAKAMPATLSIGQRQRVAIARALAPDPPLILADEPTSALDPGLARRVMSLMLETVRDFGTSLIMVSHDYNLVSEFGFRQAPIHINKKDNGIEAVLAS